MSFSKSQLLGSRNLLASLMAPSPGGEEKIQRSNSQPNEGSFNSDLVVWNEMIKGYAMHGQGDSAVSLYH